MATKITLPIGKPPVDNYAGDYWAKNALMIAKISPALPSFSRGLNIYSTDIMTGWTEYTKLLRDFGYSVDSYKGITVVCNVENLPTETFNSEYSPSFLQQMGDMVTPGIQELMYMTGANKPSQAVESIGKSVGGIGGGILGGAAELARKAEDWAQSTGGAVGTTMTSILAGGRVDFPHVWRSSGWAPSYSLNIRLMNPAGGSKNAQDIFIAGPLCALLLLGLPQSAQAHIYKWPFIHRLEIPGLVKMQAAALTSISVTKGGDQTGVSLSQRPWLVDVRLDFTSLHSVLIASNETNSDMPTLGDYINVIKEGKFILDNYPSRNRPAGIGGSPATGGNPKPVKYARSSPSATPLTTTLTSRSRVSSADLRISVALLVNQPNDLKNEGEIRYIERLEEDNRTLAKQTEGKESNPQYQDTLLGYNEIYQAALNSAENMEGSGIIPDSIDKPKTTSYHSPTYIEAQKWQGNPPTDNTRTVSEQQRSMQKRADELSVKLAASTVSTTINDPKKQAEVIIKQNIQDEYSPSYDFSLGIVSTGTRTGQELIATRTAEIAERIKLANASKGET